MARGRDQFSHYRRILKALSKSFSYIPLTARKGLLILNRNTPGKIGLGIRYALLRSISSRVGDNVALFPGVVLKSPELLEVGDNVSIHPFCYIEANGGVSIGSDVSIAHGVSILSSEHNYDNQRKAIKDQGLTYQPVSIEQNVWIGAKATILAGVHIESGSIVGAMALVNRDVPGDVIVGGVPARQIKTRCDLARYAKRVCRE